MTTRLSYTPSAGGSSGLPSAVRARLVRQARAEQRDRMPGCRLVSLSGLRAGPPGRSRFRHPVAKNLGWGRRGEPMTLDYAEFHPYRNAGYLAMVGGNCSKTVPVRHG